MNVNSLKKVPLFGKESKEVPIERKEIVNCLGLTIFNIITDSVNIPFY